MNKEMGVIFDEEITDTTELYRYITFSQFSSFIETESIYLSNINNWEDPWEAALEKLPTMHEDGHISYPIYSIHQEFYGQCWSLNGESDALWRIYSPNREGVLIKTTARKFKLMKELRFALLGKVKYTKSFKDIKISGSHESGLIKRDAFQHEQEVRLIAALHHIRGYDDYREKDLPPFVNIKIKPLEFIEDVIIDPRAATWFVDTVQKYCKRANFSFIPQKSKLYSNDIFENLQMYRRWVPVEEN